MFLQNVLSMQFRQVVLAFLIAALVFLVHASDEGSTNYAPSDMQIMNVMMKGAKPQEPDAYLCTAYPVTDQEAYIYKFEALANVSTAHHMLLYGCVEGPFSEKPIWNCPSMCKGSSGSILFAWAKNAPPAVLPKGVGYGIGAAHAVKTLVLQVHYARQFEENEKPDTSGLKLYTTHEKQPYIAGIFLLLSASFNIPPGHSSYYVDISCKYNKEKSMIPFAFRTHTHALGKVLTAYQYNGSYHEIGKGNPQWPQAFYPVTNKIEIKNGDYLAARCTYDSSSSSREVSVGGTGTDEMCNFYIMFYTDRSVADPFGECWTNSYPHLTGRHFPADVSVPLPPNPALEEEAKGHHHHHGMGGGGMSSSEDETTVSPPAPQEGGDVHLEHSLVFNSSWSPQQVTLGQIGGVATDKDGNVYIFHRGSRVWNAESFSLNHDFMFKDYPIAEDVIVILDKQGHLIRKFGAGQFFMPHGIEVDHEGNIWVTDVAMHQVFKIKPGETNPSLTLGHRFQHSDDLSYFCKPTDVAVLSSGDFFVSDGYCNGRVLKFNKEGKLIKAWGEQNLLSGNPPPAGAFDIPHSVTVSEDNQLVCVADRENGRIQCFDLDGNFKYVIRHPQFGPRLFAIEHCPDHGGILYAVNGPTYDGSEDIIVQGFTLDIKTGKLVETWNVPQHMKNPHDVCVHRDSQSVYVGELDPQTVWKFSRNSPTATATGHQHGSPEGAVKISPDMDKKNETKAATPGTTDKATKAEVSKVASGSINNGTSKAIEGKEAKANDFMPSVIIGILLVVPVILLLVITLLVRAHQSGKLKCYGHRGKRVFNLQGFLGNSHKGFDPLSTEESDHDLDPEDSDHEEYMAPKKSKNKA